jgi:hypothetical protein
MCYDARCNPRYPLLIASTSTSLTCWRKKTQAGLCIHRRVTAAPWAVQKLREEWLADEDHRHCQRGSVGTLQEI